MQPNCKWMAAQNRSRYVPWTRFVSRPPYLLVGLLAELGPSMARRAWLLAWFGRSSPEACYPRAMIFSQPRQANRAPCLTAVDVSSLILFFAEIPCGREKIIEKILRVPDSNLQHESLSNAVSSLGIVIVLPSYDSRFGVWEPDLHD